MPENRVEKMLDMQDKLKASLQKLKSNPDEFAASTRTQIMDATKIMLMLVLAVLDPTEPGSVPEEEYFRKLPARVATGMKLTQKWIEDITGDLHTYTNKVACRKILQRLSRIIREEVGDETP